MVGEGSERRDMRRTQPAIAGFGDGERGHEPRNIIASNSCGETLAFSHEESRDLLPSHPRSRIPTIT